MQTQGLSKTINGKPRDIASPNDYAVEILSTDKVCVKFIHSCLKLLNHMDRSNSRDYKCMQELARQALDMYRFNHFEEHSCPTCKYDLKGLKYGTTLLELGEPKTELNITRL